MVKQLIRIEQHRGVGLILLAAWLFIIGFLNLLFWKGVLALSIWPYNVGTELAPAAAIPS